jgi:tetratricopeptide (TPR) repeat protein
MRQVRNHAELMSDLRDRGNPWPDRPAREAALVLELADFGLDSSRADDRDAARRLVHAYLPLVRHPIEPDPFERFWTWAAVVVLGGANEPARSRAFVDEALARFPNEPRLVLARAFWTDKRFPLGAFANAAGEPLSAAAAAHVKETGDLYDAAMAFEETAAEARVRKGLLLHRAGRHDAALATLDAAGDPPRDAFVSHLRHVFRARALAALGRVDDAVTAYRAAVAIAPSAQSARVGLMGALLTRGDAPGAEAEAEAIQRLPPDSVDPWWRYWYGDARRLPGVFARLRELAR